MRPPRFPEKTTVPMAALRVVSLVVLIEAQALQRAPNETVEGTGSARGPGRTTRRLTSSDGNQEGSCEPDLRVGSSDEACEARDNKGGRDEEPDSALAGAHGEVGEEESGEGADDVGRHGLELELNSALSRVDGPHDRCSEG